MVYHQMELKKVIDRRHSIREYEKKKVSKRIIKKLITAASKAPSGANTQPWKFYVVSDKKKREELINFIRKYYQIHRDIIKKSRYRTIIENFYYNLGDTPCFIFIYYKKIKGFPDPVLNASAILAAENLMLAAVDEGLGTCWINAFAHREKVVNKILNIPKDERLTAPLIIGYPKKGYSPLKRSKKKINEILKFI